MDIYKDEPNDNIIKSESFRSKIKITEKALDNGNTKNIQIVVPLKNLSNFWRTLEMPLINCEISLDLTWSKKCVMSFAVGKTEFRIPESKPPFITLWTEENSKLLKQLESGFKRKTNWNKY